MKRLLSLDVMRGLTIALMITVNTPGSWAYVYPPLRHAKWHGCTPTDLVFPFFLFIVGTAMWYSFQKFKDVPKKRLVLKVLKRTVLIFLVGLFLNTFPFFNFEKMRIMGVLQRIALAYGLAGFLLIFLKTRQLFAVGVFLLLGYWAVLYFGGNPPYAQETNFARTIDLAILGERHMWKGLGFPFDPEGFLATFPAIVTVLLGYFAGGCIALSASVVLGVKRLLIIGFVLTILGWGWGLIFPINKSLWTSSYVLYAAGLATLLLAILLWLIDEKGCKKWAMPFVHFGMNPLFIFVLSGLYVKMLLYAIKLPLAGEMVNGYTYLYKAVFVPLAGNMNGSLLFALSHIFMYWIVVYILYRLRVFVKI